MKVLTSVIALLCPSAIWAACPDPITNGYSYCRELTIDHTQVPSTQSSVPVVIKGIYWWLKTTANGGYVVNGNDILLTSDSAGTMALPCDSAVWNGSTGLFERWTLTDVSTTTDTTLYLYYGKSGVSSSPCTASAVWDANYLAVWHLGDGTTASYVDSTSNGNNLTPGAPAPIPLIGKVGGALGFVDGVTAALSASATGLNISGGPLTLELWAQFGGYFANNTIWPFIYKKSPSQSVGYEFNVMQTNPPNGETANTWYYENESLAAKGLSDTITTPFNTWTHYAITYGLSGNATWADLIRDGTLRSSGLTGTGYPLSSTGNAFFLGSAGASTPWWYGIADEVRVSNTNRSLGYLQVQYATESNPSFIKISGQYPQGTASTVVQ